MYSLLAAKLNSCQWKDRILACKALSRIRGYVSQVRLTTSLLDISQCHSVSISLLHLFSSSPKHIHRYKADCIQQVCQRYSPRTGSSPWSHTIHPVGLGMTPCTTCGMPQPWAWSQSGVHCMRCTGLDPCLMGATHSTGGRFGACAVCSTYARLALCGGFGASSD